PYYNQAQPFDRSDPANQGIRLTARLDGFSVQDVNAAIDRAQQVFVVPQYHYVVVDDDPNAVAGDLDLMPELKDNVLVPREQAFVFDSTNEAITSAPGPVIGYVSHGVNDRSGGLHHGYISDELQFELANGAVFHTHESFNAVSFEAGGNQGGQGLVAEWLAVGGTAGVGHVEEPSAGQFNVTNEDILFDRLLDGFTLAEAAWAATWQLSYVNTVVGDPLMVMRPALPGDTNLDGMVTLSDFIQLQNHFGQVGGWTDGDFNGDGMVTIADFAILQSNYGAGTGSSAPGAVPEPATGLLVLIGAGLACRRPRRCSASR
ncbi:MAG: dockerin type I domain-containing protein, partial [Phycisphaeraceae bacterium]